MNTELLSLGGMLTLTAGAVLLSFSGYIDDFSNSLKKKPTKEMLERRRKTTKKKQASRPWTLQRRRKPAERDPDDICSDHDDDCYTPNDDGTPHDALGCWLSAPECGICPLLQRGEKKCRET